MKIKGRKNIRGDLIIKFPQIITGIRVTCAVIITKTIKEKVTRFSFNSLCNEE